MQTYELLVEGRSIRSNSSDNTLVRTSIGIDQIHVMFDNAEWLSFPLTVTFAQDGVSPVTKSLTVGSISGSDEWVAEATTVIPYEVITMIGPIRVTFQGTDASGNHIITAKGSPLRVEESGDVTLGDIPADAPTVSEWQQARADAQALLNEAQTLVNTLQDQLDSLVNDASVRVDGIVDMTRVPATRTSLGLVSIGDGLNVTDGGEISTVATNGISAEQARQIENLAALAYYDFDTEFDGDGYLRNTAKVKASAIPVDGLTIGIGDDGKLKVIATSADSEVF